MLEGRVIEHAEVRSPGLRRPFPDGLGDRLSGVRVDRVNRRGKYLLLHLSSEDTLLVHLGMSGRVTVHCAVGEAPQQGMQGEFEAGKHDHVVFRVSGGTLIAYRDPRRFGVMDLVATAEVESHPSLRQLGPEPLGNSFNQEALQDCLKARKAPIKSALMDQRNVAGLGNIYVCEALWDSEISPLRPSFKLTARDCGRLADSIRQVLLDAIEAGGSSLNDHRGVDGELGLFQHGFRVYDCKDRQCLREGCGGTITRVVQSGRSSFYCPACQV